MLLLFLAVLFGLDGLCLNILFTYLSCKCLTALPHLSGLLLRSSHKPYCSDTTAIALNRMRERILLFTTREFMPLHKCTMGIMHNILARKKSAVDWKISKTLITYTVKMIKKNPKTLSVVEFHQCSTVQTSSTELNS